MDVLREREVKDNIERQLLDEQKMRGKSSINSKWCYTINEVHANRNKMLLVKNNMYKVIL